MVLPKYKDIINEITTQKEKEADPEKKANWENIELCTRKIDRTTEIQYRMDKLYREARMIEYLCLAGNYVEFKLKEMILSVQDFLILCKKPKLNIKNLEEETLGGLIHIFKNYCIDDKDLIQKLKNFNTLRIKTIHKLFDVNYQVSDVEKEIYENFNAEDFYRNSVNPIQSYTARITYKIYEIKSKDKSFPQETQIVLEKIYEKIKEIIGNIDNLDKNLKFIK